MNKARLRSVMALHSEHNGDLAKLLGIAYQTFSNKLNEHSAEFTQSEIMKIKKHYGLSAEEVDEIFFTEKVS